ncbi:MAG TPA: hypothetical protein VHS06_12515, partial [Chloroflexota bacterium]|nr:hypothetical protein [Chloroflexota bacterium]
MQDVDTQVVTALRQANFTAEEVQSIYQSFPIGTPKRDSAYLARLVEDADRKIARTEAEARRVRGLNFEVVKVVHVNGLYPAYLLTVTLQDESEHTVSVAHAAIT